MAIEIKAKTLTSVQRTIRVELNRGDFVELMKTLGYNLPRDAEIYVQVPGGGDYSNCSLEIDKDCPVIIRWTTRTEEVTGDDKA